MDDQHVTLILRAIDAVDDKVTTLSDDVREQSENHETRLAALEEVRAEHKGATRWLKHVPPAMAAISGSSAGVVVTLLVTGR